MKKCDDTRELRGLTVFRPHYLTGQDFLVLGTPENSQNHFIDLIFNQ